MVATTSNAVRPQEAASERSIPSDSAALVRPFEQDDFDRNVWAVFGLPVDVSTVAGAALSIEQAVRDNRRVAFVTPNVNMLCAAASRPNARADILDHDLSFADGAPLVKLAKLAGAPLEERCAGSDIFEALRNRAGFRGRRLKVFFFGGRDGAAEAAHEALNDRPGGLESVGFLNPGFGDLEAMSTPAIIEEINAAGPDFIVVALGAEKGNRWIVKNADRLDAPVMSHLGAVVDFTAGSIQRAPAWMGRTGLEWAWRIIQEPSLWKRYAKDAMSLASLIVKKAAPLALVKPRAVDAPAKAVFADGVVRLTGDLKQNDLDSVRQAFRAAAAADGDVRLDLAPTDGHGGVGLMDGAFLGLVMMLEKHLARRGAKLLFGAVTPRQRRFFHLQGLRYNSDAQSLRHRDGRSGIAEAA